MNRIRFMRRGNIEIVIGTGTHHFPRQTHESYIFGILLSGTEILCIGEKSFEMQPGWCYVLPSDTPLEVLPQGEICYLSVCLKQHLAQALRQYEPDCYITAKGGDRLLYAVQGIWRGQLEEQALLQELSSLFSFHRRKAGAAEETISRAVRYLKEHADSKYQLEALSREVNLSKYYLTRVFKKAMGITPKQYHQQCRLRLIKSRAMRRSQSELAYEMDFSSQSHMESVFLENMGISLGQYIASIREEPQ